ncbi:MULTISPECIES: DUF4190 domain-containing protein [unclassified Streptomyces]|uniref:DUF4190 domain-containing protein n=1 Tax=unclassified Streptomyces TaxID=2593676 RepID=UPI00331B1CC2
MAENQAQPPGGPEPRDRDPWAPPASSAPQDKVPLHKPVTPAPPVPPVHDQMTVTSMPGVGDTGSVPPPPIAPGGPARPAPGPYGYPAAPPVTGPGAGDPFGHAGYPGYQTYGQPGWQAAPANGMGTTAMVLGILSVCLFCLYGVVAIVLGVLALIFGILGRKRVQRGEATNGGMALSGIILGSVGIVIGLVVVGLLAWGITEAINDERNRNDDFGNTLVIDSAAPPAVLSAAR